MGCMAFVAEPFLTLETECGGLLSFLVLVTELAERFLRGGGCDRGEGGFQLREVGGKRKSARVRTGTGYLDGKGIAVDQLQGRKGGTF